MKLARLLPLVALMTLLSSCGGSKYSFDFVNSLYEPVTPAVASSPYASRLADCTFNASRSTPCTLNELPFIGLDSSRITIDSVMNHVLASQPWMSERFRQLLETLPDDVLQMMKPVTAIVITGKVRPSYYRALTGAIYIDPQNLWTTQDELNTINHTPDYRNVYASRLNISTLWRYAKDNTYAYKYYALDSTETRTIDDIKLPFFALLVHEMSHAGDYVPPGKLSTIRKDIPFYEAILQLDKEWINTRLYSVYPLHSSLWKGLAEVWYAGKEPSSQQLALTPIDVAGEFSDDRASDDYAYHTRTEDVAMLTEETLMAIYHGVQRDYAITNTPQVENPTSADYQVGWGQRGRIGEPRVREAAAFVLGELLPGVDFSASLQTLAAPTQMTVGATWADNLTLGSRTRKVPLSPRDQNRPATGDIERL
ncbi:MAG: hypothetical protein QM758_20790 [Armatimonas sp.]